MSVIIASVVVLAAVVFLLKRKNNADGNEPATGARGRSGADKK